MLLYEDLVHARFLNADAFHPPPPPPFHNFPKIASPPGGPTMKYRRIPQISPHTDKPMSELTLTDVIR